MSEHTKRIKMTDAESIKLIQNKLDLKRMLAIEKRCVVAETELETVYIKQVTGKQDTEKIRSIINAFNEVRNEMNRYRWMYVSQFQNSLKDRERYEARINELESFVSFPDINKPKK